MGPGKGIILSCDPQLFGAPSLILLLGRSPLSSLTPHPETSPVAQVAGSSKGEEKGAVQAQTIT